MKKTILITDDESGYGELMRDLLELSNYNAYYVESKPGANFWAIANHPDLIITDIMAPEISGITLLQLIRQTNATKDIPVLIISGTIPHNEPVARR